MTRSPIACLLATAIAFAGATQASGEPICRPALAFQQVGFSPMQPPALERKWTALLSVDASRCATTSGRFAIGFSRLKENGFEFEFQEHFLWRPDRVAVSVDFWADEAVERYWLTDIADCPCRK